MLTKETLLEFRHFLESAQWGLFSERVLEAELNTAMEQLLICPLEDVEKYRGQIRAIKHFLNLKGAARTAYEESKNDRL